VVLSGTVVVLTLWAGWRVCSLAWLVPAFSHFRHIQERVPHTPALPMALRLTPATLLKLQSSTEHTRNICVIAHVDHGKTTCVTRAFRSPGVVLCCGGVAIVSPVFPRVWPMQADGWAH